MDYITPKYQQPIDDFSMTIGTEEYSLGKLHGDCARKISYQFKDMFKGLDIEGKVKSVSSQ